MTTPPLSQAVTIVFNWRVEEPNWEAFRGWENGINTACSNEMRDGFMGVTILESPIDAKSRQFWVILKFASSFVADRWLQSKTRQWWLDELDAKMLATGTGDFQRNDEMVPFLEARDLRLCTPSGNMPPKWRQMSVTWTLVYSLGLLLGRVLPMALPGFVAWPPYAKMGLSMLISCAMNQYFLMAKAIRLARAVGFFPR